MPFLLVPVCPIVEGGNNLNQYVVPAKPKGRGFQRNPRCGSLELVSDDGASRRWGVSHRLDKDTDTGAAEFGKPACFDKLASPIDDQRVECAQRSAVLDRVNR